MKTILIAIALSLPTLALNTLAQNPGGSPLSTGSTGQSGQVQPPPPPGNRPPPPQLLEKLQNMSPEQRQQFLQDHPRLQQFIKNHPGFAQKTVNGPEAGAGIKDPGHPRVNEVNKREQNLQNRITQGVQNGSLTPQQAANLEKGENRIQQQESTDLQKNNGHLTPGEDRQLNREENRESRRINGDEHGGGRH